MNLGQLIVSSRNLLEQALAAVRPGGIDERREADRQLLARIQGNIVQQHGLPCTSLWFFRFPEAWNDQRCRNYLRSIAGAVTSAAEVRGQRRARKTHPAAEPGFFLGFGLTTSGIRRANVSNPEERHVANRDFTRGMTGVDRANNVDPGVELGDPVDDQGRPTQWDRAYLEPIDGAWIIGHEAGAAWRAELDRWAGELVEVTSETGRTQPHEPFGFRDGLVQNAFFRGQKASSYWANLALRSVLIDAATPHRDGSFLVYRKLEQDVQAFRDFEVKLRAAIPAELFGGGDPGALLVGRQRDGTPLGRPRRDRYGDFSFLDDMKGRGCPFHAHIRKSNPRGTLANEWQNTRDTQFVRRSVVYDPDGQLGGGGPPYPRTGVGLLFLGYMSDIGRQFMAMHKTWLMQKEFPEVPGKPHGVDPLMFGDREDQTWRWKRNGTNWQVPGLSSFVRAKGGAYLYVPAKAWLAHPS